MENINRILIVSRMTQYCREAVRYGISLARKFGAEITVIHVVHNPFGLEGWNLPIISLDDEYRRIMEQAKADIHRIIREEKGAGLAIEELIKSGDPTTEILDTVRDKKIDLVIMLAHEEGRLEHFLFGRSNEELIRRLPCNMLLVKKEPEPVRW